MFKNCCGCPGKKTGRNDSEENEDEDEKKEKEMLIEKREGMDETVNPVAETEAIAAAVALTVSEEAAKLEKETSKDNELFQVKKKKPKPRLSISAEVKIIPTNFPDNLEDISFAEEEQLIEDEAEAGHEDENDEDKDDDDDDDPESVTISVKNIDGKIIRKSTSEELVKPCPDGEIRAISPLSDEVFDAGEKSHLELPLNNLGVKMPPSDAADHNLSTSSTPWRHSSRAQKRVSMPAVLPRWQSEEEETGGALEPPATPVARDELALRRHRFFSELLSVAQAATEHKVRFDPLGPAIEIISEGDPSASQAQVKEFDSLLNRLEFITSRLEKVVPLLEKSADTVCKSVSLTKSIQDLLDEHLTPTEKESLRLLLVDSRGSDQGSGEGKETEVSETKEISEDKDGFVVISPDSSADFEELNEGDLTLDEEAGAEEIGFGSDLEKNQNVSDNSENSRNSENTVVVRMVLDNEREDGANHLTHSKSIGESIGVGSLTGNNKSAFSMSLQGFQQVLQGPFASYLQISSQIGGDVAEHAKIVQEAFQAQMQYLSLAAQSGKPSQGEEMKLLQPTSQRIEAVQSYREKHRTSNYFNHLSAISESIPALGWVAISPAPAPYIKEMNDAGQFYTNRVLKDWKEKDKIHVDWTKSWIQTLADLQAFVKQYHTTGLVWGGTTPARSGGAPPPPPGGLPPPPPTLDLGDVAPGGPGLDRSALFAEINQGENITRNLKKVTPDMQTHKNPVIRAGPAPFKAPPSSIQNQIPRPFKASSPPEKPAKFAREGKKWFIEYQKDNHQLVVDNAEMNNVLYLFKCVNSTLVVKGKVNSIFLDSCKKTAVVFDSVVSSIEFVNCQSVQMQVLGLVPTITIDKTDGCQIYLSQESMNVEIISSKSSEMNVLIPTGSGDFKEYPVPEQFKTTVGKQGLSTCAVENKG